MPLSETAQKNYTRMFGDFPPPLADSDPEFTRLFLDFALDEIGRASCRERVSMFV